MTRATIAQYNVTVGRRVVPPVHPCPLLSSAQGQDSPRGSDATSKRHRNIGATFPTISFLLNRGAALSSRYAATDGSRHDESLSWP